MDLGAKLVRIFIFSSSQSLIYISSSDFGLKRGNWCLKKNKKFLNLGFIIWYQILWFECMIIGGKESISFWTKNQSRNCKHKWKPYDDNIECEKFDMFSLLIWTNLNYLFNLLVFFSWSTSKGPNWTLNLESTLIKGMIGKNINNAFVLYNDL
jgi:hypothetical protein